MVGQQQNVLENRRIEDRAPIAMSEKVARTGRPVLFIVLFTTQCLRQLSRWLGARRSKLLHFGFNFRGI